jgi:hypothetical protein
MIFLLNWFRAAWLRLRRRSKYSGVRHVRSMSDLPEQLGSSIYLVGPDSSPKWAVMSCPCRCGSRIDVNLMRTQQPHWEVTLEFGTITLLPSLWRRSRDTCGSHFFIVRNKVRWV